jgi:alpha-beta hydrolase superfamily lysophospholipase
MKTKLFILSAICLVTLNLQALTDTLKQQAPINLETKTGKIRGSILVPQSKKPVPVVLIIAGSGPTDRNGNNPVMQNNSLKMLAEALFKNNIASVRYDKRGIAESKEAGQKEQDMRFDDLVNDAEAWIKLLKQDERFSKVIVVGHSEGSLIGMIAANNAKADAYISVAGAGQPADKILREQLKNLPPDVLKVVLPILDSLAAGKTVDDVDPSLSALFRLSVQPYMISWFKYDPRTEIKKLTIPVLILQGTTDIQVSVDDAKNLSNANPKAQIMVIDNMNHIFKEAEADREKNVATYSNPNLPIVPQFIDVTTKFVLSIK